MYGWFSGKELLERWKILEMDLFEYVKKGLLPHNKEHKVKLSPYGMRLAISLANLFLYS
jgi:hypothetical protein